MSEQEIQKILFLFGGAFFLTGNWMIYLEKLGPSIAVFGLAALLIGVASVGPSTIKTLGAKWGSSGGQIGFDRYQPTEEERELSIKLAQDKPSPEIEKEGQEFIKKAEDRAPEKRSPEEYLALATEKWRAKDYDGALADAFAGLALNPENIRIKSSLVHRIASVYKGLGLRDQAVKYYKEAIELDSKFSMPHNNLGVVYYEQGELEKAETEYNKAIALYPKIAEPYNNLGLIYHNQGKLEEAKKEYEEALRLEPDYFLAHENLEKLKRRMERDK